MEGKNHSPSSKFATGNSCVGDANTSIEMREQQEYVLENQEKGLKRENASPLQQNPPQLWKNPSHVPQASELQSGNSTIAKEPERLQKLSSQQAHGDHRHRLLQVCEFLSTLRDLVDENRKKQLFILYDKYKRHKIPQEGFIQQVKDIAGGPSVELAICKLQNLRQGKTGNKAPGISSHNRVSLTSGGIDAQKSDPRGVHVNQLPSTGSGTLSSSATVLGLDKNPQQHIQLPSSSGTLSSSATSVGGPTISTINMSTVPKFEKPISVNVPSSVKGSATSSFQNNSSLPLDSPHLQGFDQAMKSCSLVPQSVSNVPMKENNGNPRNSNDNLEKQSSESTPTTRASFLSPSMTTYLDCSIMGKTEVKAPGRPSQNRVSLTSTGIDAQNSDPRGVHVNQLPSTNSGTLSSSGTVLGPNKNPQQHIQLPSSTGTLSSSATSVGGPTISMINMSTVPKFERPTSANDPSRVHDTISHFQTSSSLPLDSPHLQVLVTKDQTMGPFSSVVIDQRFDQAWKPCSLVPHSVSNVPMKQNNGNLRNSNDNLEKQSSESTPTTHASFLSPSIATHLDSSTMAGTNVLTTPNMPSISRKKPLETRGSSLPPSRKKQKVCSTSSRQRFEQLNDVTAYIGIDLEEEEEQLLPSSHKKDGRVSKASQRVVHEEEERRFLQKIPLQRKLTKIMVKSGLKHVSNDVERCLSMCVEERMRGLLSNVIRLSKQIFLKLKELLQRTDVEKCRNRTFITSDIRKQIKEMNQKMKEEWERNRRPKENKLQNEENGTDKEDNGSKQAKANEEAKDTMRAKANVAANAAVGGNNAFLKWKLMAEARQKPSSEPRKNSKKPNGETDGRRFGKKQGPQKVVRSISVNDVIAAVERESQMSRSTLLYRLYNRISSDDV